MFGWVQSERNILQIQKIEGSNYGAIESTETATLISSRLHFRK